MTFSQGLIVGLLRNPNNPENRRYDIAVSDDLGKTWENKGKIVSVHRDADHLSDWSYPWMTPINNNDWLIVFYAGISNGSNSIYGVTLNPHNK